MGTKRSRWTLLVVGAAVLLLCSACDWTQYLGNAALNGKAVDETTISSANVASLAPTFSLPLSGTSSVTSAPSISQGVLYTATGGLLVAASADGSTNCSGTPVVCQPLWTASPGTFDNSSQPLVSGGVVYVTFADNGGSTSDRLVAYDAAGTTNCSGSPKVCQPLWTAAVSSVMGPNLADGTVFVSDFRTGQLEAFAAGATPGCAGSPEVCQPLWTASIGSLSVPSVAAGRVYVVTAGPTNPMPEVAVYDAAGATNCSGTPTVCQPLWTVPLTDGGTGSVDVSNGVGYVETGFFETPPLQLVAFDATGTSGCAGVPVVCQPMWTATLRNTPFYNTPSVANGRVYAASITGVDVFDANGVTNCSGSPKTCGPLFETALGPGGLYFAAPSLANGLLLVGNQIFDGSGVEDCTTAAVPLCSPLWSGSKAAESSDLADGSVYVTTSNGTVLAYRVPGT